MQHLPGSGAGAVSVRAQAGVVDRAGYQSGDAVGQGEALIAVASLARSGDLLWVLVGLGFVVSVASRIHAAYRRRAIHQAIGKLVRRHEGWHRQAWPCGVQPDLLVGRFAATPRGDRRYGVRYAVGGRTELEIAGSPTTCQVAYFEWFSEDRRQGGSRQGHRPRYEKRTELVALTQLPVHVPRKIAIGPESLLGRTGLTRSGAQLESDAFNRRFRVEGAPRTLVVQLLDANLQQVLLDGFSGRGVEFSDDLLVLSGRPTHRDPSLDHLVGSYAAMHQDLGQLCRAIPAQFWRAIGWRRREETPATSDQTPTQEDA